MDIGWLVVSIVVSLCVALRTSRAVVCWGPDRPWIFLAVVSLFLTSSVVVSSACGALTARGLLVSQAIIGGAALWMVSRMTKRGNDGRQLGRRDRVGLSGVELALLATIGLAIGLSAARQLIAPISGWDERMYHASRVSYWMQHKGVAYFDTHNERQVVFPWLGEAFFMWPLLFVKVEWVGRMFFWLAYPLSVWGVGSLCRACGLSRVFSLAAALVFAVTPTVFEHACNLKSDLWSPVYMLGAVYFAVRRAGASDRQSGRWVAVGVFVALAVSVKSTALALGPGLLFAACCGVRFRDALRNGVTLCAAFLGGLVGSGFLLLVISNRVHYGGWLGSPALLKVVGVEVSVQQLATYAARVPLFLVDFPDLSLEPLRQSVESAGGWLARVTGADTVLPLERPPWPGNYQFTATPAATKFSTAGMLWLPCLAIFLVGAARQALRTWPRVSVDGARLVAIIQTPLLVGVVFMVRWMGGGPERFWLGAYALSVPLTLAVVDRVATRWARCGVAVATIVLIATLYPSLLQSGCSQLNHLWSHPPTPERLDEPYQEVVPLLPAGAHVLLVASGGTRDYPLFAPRSGFCNTVVSWGIHPFSPQRLAEIVRAAKISHIVIENDHAIGYHWAGGMDTTGMTAWLAASADFRGIPLTTPNMRLFVRQDAAP